MYFVIFSFRTNKESRWSNPKKIDYTPVSDKNKTAQDVESEGNINGKKEKSSSKNKYVGKYELSHMI